MFMEWHRWCDCLGMGGCSARAGTVSHMGGHVDFTLRSRVRHWDRLWSSAVKGEGVWLVLSCCHPTALWILP